MFRAIEGASVLLLLAVFLAYLLAPAIDRLRTRVHVGRRDRPLPRIVAILLVYAGLFAAGAVAWRLAAPVVTRWVRVTAPTAIDQVFGGGDHTATVDRFYARAPLPARLKPFATRATMKASGYLESEVRTALDDLVGGARYVRWLAVTPVVAFLLLAYAPGFRRSAIRVLPHGHLQWRGAEYLRDVNSALAGYVRAQVAAAVIVGILCAIGFVMFGLPYGWSMGIVAGVLELVPVIGPLTVMLMAAGQAGRLAIPVIVFLIALRGVQDYYVYPRLIRHGMHLSSVVVILALWLGAVLNGAAGVVLAIPVAGFMSVSLRHWREYRALERLVRTAPAARGDAR